jgi:hypothetical protein
MRTLAALLASALMAVPALAQQPRDGARRLVTGDGRVWGVVTTDAAEPKPLRRARVTLNGPDLIVGRTTLTNDDGVFSFDAVPPGSYTVGAVKEGYVAVNFGAKRPARPGTAIALRRGEVRRLDMAMPRGAAITGIVTDPDGQPAAGITVAALTWRYLGAGGERRLVPAGMTISPSDDRGVYRIFGLPAGEYLIAAQQRDPNAGADLKMLSASDIKRALADVRAPASLSVSKTPGPIVPPRPAPAPAPAPAPTDPPRRVAFAQIFYPGTAAVAQARRVSVNAGEERGSVDFQMDYVPAATVQGTVVVNAGNPQSAAIMLVQQNQSMFGEGPMRQSRALADGRFTFSGVPPGEYTVMARFVPASGPNAPVIPQAHWAMTDVVVNGQDIPDLVLAPQPGLIIQGRVAFEGSGMAPRLPAGRLSLPLTSMPIGTFTPIVQPAPDGGFAVHGMQPGPFRTGPLPGSRTPLGRWWLKSAILNGRDLLDEPLEFRNSEVDLVVTFSDRASELTGTVTDARSEPLSTVVIAFSTNRTSWFFNSRRIAAVRADAQGRYSIRNLPPGDYFVMQTDDLEQGEWFDPAVLERLIGDAAPIPVTEYGKKIHDIKVTSR